MASRIEVWVLRLDDGRDLAFAECGDPDGRPVFFFHGTPGSHAEVSLIDEEARQQSIRLITPDRPGYGHSTLDPNRSLTDWPSDVLAIGDELQLDRFGVIGLSGGGPHALVCAQALGERLTGCVIASGVGAIHDRSDSEGMMATNRMLTRIARRASFLLPAVFRATMFAGRRLSPEKLLDQMTSQLPPADAEIMRRPEIAEKMMGLIRQKHPTIGQASAQDFALFAQPWGFRIEDITVPVHLWHGDADLNVPVAHAHRHADLIKNSTLHLEAGQGHLLIFDKAHEILAAAAGSEAAGKSGQ